MLYFTPSPVGGRDVLSPVGGRDVLSTTLQTVATDHVDRR